MPLILLLFAVITIVYFFIILIYSSGWRFTEYFIVENILSQTKISVVIAARNEAANIKACLMSIYNQNYPKDLFEVIVVDDHSEDETVKVASQFENCKIIKLHDQKTNISQSFKKQALTKGIEAAIGELILTTDADCIAEENWLKTIAVFYETYNPKMILMPVRFESENSLLNLFQQMDLSGLIGITAGSLFYKFPVMANGSNMAFEKKAFETVNGFTGNENIPGGDDIFMLLKIKEKFPEAIRFLKSKEATVTTKAVSTFNEFYHQRLRWISKSGKFGDWKITAVLVWSFVFNLVILLSFTAGIILSSKLLLISAIAVLIFKWVVEFPIVKNVSEFLGHPFSFPKYIFSNLSHQWYVLVFGILSLVKRYEWKGRKY